MEAPHPSLSLLDDVYLCVVDGHAVFLDLGKDDYSAVPLQSAPEGEDAHAVGRYLAQELSVHKAELESAGLVSEGAADRNRLADFLSLTHPSDHFLGRDDSRCFGFSTARPNRPKVEIGDVVGFYLACWKASRLLKRRHISKIAARVRRRKDRRPAELRVDELRRQLLIFRRLRPWYPRSYLCLWDALALLEFLARRRLFPEWVFGVQVEPFGAHCWLQTGDKVLNDDTEYARQFTPIMSV
jgi:hypothetical protein